MLEAPTDFIVIFIVVSVMLIVGMAVFIVITVYRYQQKQNAYFKDLESLKTSHENLLLQSQLEIQEQTFQTISREIHDNIGQKLSLAKLYLNTVEFEDVKKTRQLVNDGVYIIGEAIKELTDLSRSMSSEIILNYGLIKALEFEAAQLAKPGIYTINFSATGSSAFLDTDTELVLFRIVQEVLNNVIKHAGASVINIILHYTTDMLTIEVNDNGKGFNPDKSVLGTGLQNIKKRADTLKANVSLTSKPDIGTNVKIEISLHENNKKI